MRHLLLILLCCVLGGSTMPEPTDRVVFGVRISVGANSQIVSYVAMRYSPDGVLREKRNYTHDEFIRVVSGDWPSSYNPKKQNLFELNGVQGGVIYNDTFKKSYPYCPAFDSLWKIRYSDYPFKGGERSGTGWSLGIYSPSLKQQKYIADHYHIKYLDTDFIIDTNFWQLLKDVQDSAWISSYKNLK